MDDKKHAVFADPPPPYSVLANYQDPKLVNDLPTVFVVKPDTFGPLEKFPAITTCYGCLQQVSTNVEKNINGGGWIWAILCCLCGSWLLSFLVMCLDCFHEWCHYCPRCNAKLATYSPPASCGMISLIAFLTLGIIALQVLVFIYYVLPMIQDPNYFIY